MSNRRTIVPRVQKESPADVIRREKEELAAAQKAKEKAAVQRQMIQEEVVLPAPAPVALPLVPVTPPPGPELVPADTVVQRRSLGARIDKDVIKAMSIYAIQHDIKDYDVWERAAREFLERHRS